MMEQKTLLPLLRIAREFLSIDHEVNDHEERDTQTDRMKTIPDADQNVRIRRKNAPEQGRTFVGQHQAKQETTRSQKNSASTAGPAENGNSVLLATRLVNVAGQ